MLGAVSHLPEKSDRYCFSVLFCFFFLKSLLADHAMYFYKEGGPVEITS